MMTAAIRHQAATRSRSRALPWRMRATVSSRITLTSRTTRIASWSALVCSPIRAAGDLVGNRRRERTHVLGADQRLLPAVGVETVALQVLAVEADWRTGLGRRHHRVRLIGVGVSGDNVAFPSERRTETGDCPGLCVRHHIRGGVGALTARLDLRPHPDHFGLHRLQHRPPVLVPGLRGTGHRHPDEACH